MIAGRTVHRKLKAVAAPKKDLLRHNLRSKHHIAAPFRVTGSEIELVLYR